MKELFLPDYSKPLKLKTQWWNPFKTVQNYGPWNDTFLLSDIKQMIKAFRVYQSTAQPYYFYNNIEAVEGHKYPVTFEQKGITIGCQYYTLKAIDTVEEAIF